VFTTTQSRAPRAVLTVLALLSFTLGAMPLPSPAAPAAKSVAKTTAKTVAKKPVKKATGYHPHTGLAPADEYFGRLGMSVLGVRNKVKDLGLDADTHPDHDNAVLSNALWVEDAMRDWAKKYPFDRWLPRYAYALEQMYERIPGDDAHKRALKQISYLTAYFPQTLYGKIGRAKLALGVPVRAPSESPIVLTDLERLALLDGKVTPTIPPAATPVPTASPSPPPTQLGTPAAAPASTTPVDTGPAPAPAATPSSPPTTQPARP
jgi:hypothetical protein